ncbi:MAG: hypothetical protein ACLU4N_03025 [Butyricimonas faecihominis]
MPQPEEDDYNEIFNYLVKVSSPDFFDDKAIENLQAFYYAALTETGMYAYNTKPFKKFFKDEPEPIITFNFAMPKGYENARSTHNNCRILIIGYRPMRKHSFHLRSDPWSATAVDLKKTTNAASTSKPTWTTNVALQVSKTLPVLPLSKY